MNRLTRALTGLLTRSGWLMEEDRAEWLEGLVAEATETSAGRDRVVWLIGGAWLIAAEALRRSAIRILAFIAAAAVVLLITWRGSSSDSAVLVNRIEIPLCLGLLALLPLVVRRFFGPVGDGLLPRTVRVVGYLVVLALVTAKAVEAREGEKLGAYFSDGGKVAGLIVLVIAGYAGAILVLTSQRVRLNRSALAIAIGIGALTGVALFALYGYHLNTPPLMPWVLTVLALPFLIGFAVTRRAARAAPAKHMTPAQQGALVAVCATAMAALLLALLSGGPAPILLLLLVLAPVLLTGVAVTCLAARDSPGKDLPPARQGGVLAVCATGTAVLLLAALTTVTIALAPQRVPLQTPPPPPNGGCETCDPNSLVIPPNLRHEYWVGLSITQENLPFYIALVAAPMFALLAGGLGVGLAEASLGIRNRSGNQGSAAPPAPSQAQA